MTRKGINRRYIRLKRFAMLVRLVPAMRDLIKLPDEYLWLA